MLEVEIKSPTNDYKEILKKISLMGFEFRETRVEQDIYFNHPAKNFQKSDEALRIRSVGNHTILTYKGPKLGERVKSRVEHELIIENVETMTSILINLGFVPTGHVEKTRSVYNLDDMEITIDHVKGLGDFIEIETMGEDREALEAKVLDLAQQLDLQEIERRSYLEMVVAMVENQ